MSNPAPGELSLSILLSTLTTTLHAPTYVFITFPPSSSALSIHPGDIQLLFKEAEGVTIVTTLEVAQEQKLEYSFPCKMITLDVQSSLEAVGFMAIIAGKLAKRGMGVNPVSGFWHDHLFVPLGREEEAVEALRELAEEKKRESEAKQ